MDGGNTAKFSPAKVSRYTVLLVSTRVRGYVPSPFRLGWNGDTVEGVSVGCDISSVVSTQCVPWLRERKERKGR